MASAIIYVINQMTDSADPRVSTWPMMGSPVPTICLLITYIYFSKVFGPRFFKHRNPLPLSRIVQVHNLSMIVYNIIFAVCYTKLSLFAGNFNWICQGTADLSTLELTWWFLMARMLDLLDTVFFVARKKQDHVSFLHIFHHVSVVVSLWLSVNYGVLGQNIPIIVLNACVHVVMYSYYFLTTLGPKVRTYLWWKKYLTQLQIIQLIAFVVYGSFPLFIECGFPQWMSLLCVGQVAAMILMFLHFYIKSYRKQLLATQQDKKK